MSPITARVGRLLRRGSRIARLWPLLPVCMACLPGTAWSHQWYIQPNVFMQTYYNDNLRLTPAPQGGAWAAVGGISADLGVRSQVSGIILRPNLRSYTYTGYRGVGNYDHIARKASGEAYYKAETDLWQLNGVYDRDSTLTSELLDSGRVEFNIPRERWSVQPAWSSQWTPRSTVQLQGGYTRTSYRNGLVHGLHDYRVLDASATYAYSLTETQQINMTASASRFNAPTNFDDTTDNYTVQVGWINHWTERTVTNLSGGARVNRTRFNVFGIPIKESKEGYVLHAHLTNKSERTTWIADLKHNVRPTSYGILMQRDRARASVERKLSFYSNASLSGLWLRSKALQSSLEQINRTLVRLDLTVAWRYARRWTLRAAYRWTWQDYGQSSARSNAVFLSLSYRGLERSISH